MLFMIVFFFYFFFFSSRRRHTRLTCDWSSDVCSSDLLAAPDIVACGEPARLILVEEFVPGSEHALEGLLVDGELRVLALFDKPDRSEERRVGKECRARWWLCR